MKRRIGDPTWDPGEVDSGGGKVGGGAVGGQDGQNPIQLILAYQHHDPVVGVIRRQSFDDAHRRDRPRTGRGLFQHEAVLAQIGKTPSPLQD